LLKLELLLSDDFCLLFLVLPLLVDPACVAVLPSTLPGPPFLPPFMNFKNRDKAPFFLGELSFCWTAEWLGGMLAFFTWNLAEASLASKFAVGGESVRDKCRMPRLSAMVKCQRASVMLVSVCWRSWVGLRGGLLVAGFLVE